MDENYHSSDVFIPFKSNSSLLISGPTCSGKTTWVIKLLLNSDSMFTPNPPQKFLWCYGVYQNIFKDLVNKIPNFTLHEGLPNEEYLNSYLNKTPCLIILDDLGAECAQSQSVEKLFTRGCHHLNCTVLLIYQNLYQQGKFSRTITLNASYLILFKNIRDTGQISILERQIFPCNKGQLVQAYKDAVNEPFGYLIVDLTQTQNESHRIRTHIFPGQYPLVYIIE